MGDDAPGRPGGTTPSALQLTRRNIRLLYLDMSWQGLITAGITTFLAVFLVRLGASPFVLSLLTSLPALVTIVLSVAFMPLIERQPNPVRVVTLTRLGSRTCFLLIALAPFVLTGERRRFLPLVAVLLWGFSAVFSAATNPAFIAVLAEVVPPRQRPSVNGGRWAAHSLIVAVTVAIFGRLLDWWSFPQNFQIVFGLSFLAGMISTAVYDRIRLPPAQRRPGDPATGTSWRYFVQLGRASFRQPAFGTFLLTTFVYRLGLSLPAALYPIFWVDNVGASNTWIGFNTTAIYGALVVSYVLWGRAARRCGSRRILLITSAGLSFYPLLTPLVGAPIWLIPVAIIHGTFIAGIDITFFEGLLEASPPDQRAGFAAVHTSVINIAILAGPLLGSGLAAWFGIRAAFVIAGVSCLFGALLFYLLAVGSQRQPRLAESTA